MNKNDLERATTESHKEEKVVLQSIEGFLLRPV